MRLTIIAILCAATVARAADIPVDLGTVTIPDERIEDVQLWLAAQRPLTTNTYQVVTNDIGGGETEVVTNTVPVVIPETPKEKGTRIMRRIARRAILSDIRAYLSRRAKLIKDRQTFIEDQ